MKHYKLITVYKMVSLYVSLLHGIFRTSLWTVFGSNSGLQTTWVGSVLVSNAGT